jgi:hypothetical protein
MNTIQYCQHGCGQIATYTTKGSRWNSPFKGKPVHQCAASHHACPAIKQKKIETSRKNFGTDYPQQNKEHIAKIIDTNIKKYGHACSLKNPTQQAKRKATLMERYGVEQPTLDANIRAKAAKSIKQAYIDDITYADRIIQTRKEIYGNEYESIVNKTRNTQIENGRWVATEKRSAWNIYKFKVKQLTSKVYKTNKDLINPANLPIGICKYQVDHVYSIRHGFENNIPYQIIANIHNLRMLWHVDNKSKHIRSDYTIQELAAKIIGA